MTALDRTEPRPAGTTPPTAGAVDPAQGAIPANKFTAPADGAVRPPAEVMGRYLTAGIWGSSLLHEYVLRQVHQTPDAVALVGSDRRMSYRELTDTAYTVASRLRAAGLSRHDRVLLQLPNTIELITTVLALISLGVRPVLTLTSLREREIRHVAAQCAPRAFIVAAPTQHAYALQAARRLQAEEPTMTRIVVLGKVMPGTDELDLAAAHRPDPDAAFDWGSPLDHTAPVELRTAADRIGHRADAACASGRDDAGNVAFYLLSAGTTGLPKPIPRTHRDYVYNIDVSNAAAAVDASDVYLAALPVLHNFSLGCPGVLGTLAAGGRVVLCPPDPEVMLDLIERERVTLTATVPALALQLAAAARRRVWDLSGLRGIQVGGARLTPRHADELREALNCGVQQVYGMGEGLLNFTRWDDPWEVVRQTQGRPASQADEWRIVDTDDVDVRPGEPGELLVRGPYTIGGYLAPPEVNARAFTHDGYYRTGDVVRQHPSGNFVVEGRRRDFVNVCGDKVSAHELEELLVQHPAVADCAVVAAPDELLGEAVCLFAVLRVGAALTLTEVRAYLDRAGAARFKFPTRLELRDRLPTTGLGKLDRDALRRAAAIPAARTG
jgi:2,3-dihydroxybenzoate-AMP ligase